MDRLCAYFGVVGTASVVAWGAALLLLAACARSRRRTRAYLAAFALALLGFGLAKVNSHNISQIEVDRSAEEAELRARRSPPPPRPSDGGVRVSDAETVRPGGADSPGKPEERTTAPGHSYREAGKQKREEGAQLKPSDLTAVGDEAEGAIARRLPEADVIRADSYDRLNLLFARLTPWLALLLVCLDYLSRFNRTLDHLPPIPIAGRALDALFPKTHAVHVQTSDPAVVKRYLAGVVRKGETFLYLGGTDPVPASELPRWSLGKWRWRPLRKIAVSGVGFPTSGFVFDSAWFGRYCFVATSLDVARNLVADLVEYLRARTIPRAVARRTVNVVWHFSGHLFAPRLRELAALAREANFKLLVVSADPPADVVAPIFEERLSRTE